MSSSISSRARLSSIFVLIALLAAACAGAQQTASDPDGLAFADETSDPTAQGTELTEVRVAARNSILVSPLWIADSRGFFEAEGLNIDFVPVVDEGAVSDALDEGEASIGLLSSASILEGTQRSAATSITPIVYVSATDSQAVDRGSWSLIVSDSRTIETGCDLVGETVGLDSSSSVSAVAVREFVTRAGCDPSEVTIAEVVAANMEFALRLGVIDAAAVTDPATAQLLRGNTRLLANLDPELCGNVGRCPLSIGVASDEWLAANPETASAFTNAMNAAMQWISANEIAYRAELLQCCALSADDAAEIVLPNFIGENSSLETDIQRLQIIVTNRATRATTAPPDRTDANATPDAATDEPADDAADR